MRRSSRRPAADPPGSGGPRPVAAADESERDVRLLRAAGNAGRLAILARLAQSGSVAACDFDCCGVRQPTISHHLRVLREAGWVRAERRGTSVCYSLAPEAAERLGAIAAALAPANHARETRLEGRSGPMVVAGTDAGGRPEMRPRRPPQLRSAGR